MNIDIFTSNLKRPNQFKVQVKWELFMQCLLSDCLGHFLTIAIKQKWQNPFHTFHNISTTSSCLQCSFVFPYNHFMGQLIMLFAFSYRLVHSHVWPSVSCDTISLTLLLNPLYLDLAVPSKQGCDENVQSHFRSNFHHGLCSAHWVIVDWFRDVLVFVYGFISNCLKYDHFIIKIVLQMYKETKLPQGLCSIFNSC